jgi:hypothetical protein
MYHSTRNVHCPTTRACNRQSEIVRVGGPIYTFSDWRTIPHGISIVVPAQQILDVLLPRFAQGMERARQIHAARISGTRD